MGFQQLFVENIDGVRLRLEVVFQKEKAGLPAFSF